MIRLEAINRDNVWDVCELSVKTEQLDFVAKNSESIIEAYVEHLAGEVIPLPFAIYNDDLLVGFVMIGYGYTEGDPEVSKDGYVLWRFMIDKAYQSKGYGKAAMPVILDYIRTQPVGSAKYCWLSYEGDNENARKLYASFGFVENGETCEDEIVAVLKL